jgi:hypothetical protein
MQRVHEGPSPEEEESVRSGVHEEFTKLNKGWGKKTEVKSKKLFTITPSKDRGCVLPRSLVLELLLR